MDNNLKEKLGLNYGIKVSEITGGKFAEVGIPEGFIILQINNRKVKAKTDVYEIMDQIKQKDGGILIKGINPDGSKGYYGFGLE